LRATGVKVYAGNAGPFLHRCVRYETADGAGSDSAALAIGLTVSLVLLVILLVVVAAVCFYKRRHRNKRTINENDVERVKMSPLPDEDPAES